MPCSACGLDGHNKRTCKQEEGRGKLMTASKLQQKAAGYLLAAANAMADPGTASASAPATPTSAPVKRDKAKAKTPQTTTDRALLKEVKALRAELNEHRKESAVVPEAVPLTPAPEPGGAGRWVINGRTGKAEWETVERREANEKQPGFVDWTAGARTCMGEPPLRYSDNRKDPMSGLLKPAQIPMLGLLKSKQMRPTLGFHGM
jgi:hypothetical protein